MPARKRAGRPPLPPSEVHSARINVRLTRAELRALAELQRAEGGVPAVEVVRRLIVRARQSH